MTKTAWAERMSDAELAEITEGMTENEREQVRLANVTGPLLDMWHRFEGVFGDRAIDRLDVSDEDAEAMAMLMEGIGPSGAAFAYLLRSISSRRRMRALSHKVRAVWAADGTSELLSIPEVHERYAKLPKGDA